MNVLEARRRLLGRNVYKHTTEGNPAIAQGSLARRYPGVTMQGWTEQDGTPTPEAPVPIVSAGKYNEETQKYEYWVKLTGANLFDPEKLTGGEIVEYNGVQCYKYTDNLTNFTYIDDFAENTQYCFSVMILSSEGNEEKTTDIFIVYTDGTRIVIKVSHDQLTNAVSLANKTVAMITGSDSWSVVRYIDLTITTLGIGTEPLPYQPYKNQTVTLTADRPLTKWDKLEKRDGQWGWVYKSNEVVLDGSEDEYWKISGSNNLKAYTINNLNNIQQEDYEAVFCNKFKGVSFENRDFSIDCLCMASKKSEGNQYVRFNYFSIEDLSAWKIFLQSNPIIIDYETSEETFVPLSLEGQEAMNTLRTFRPTTVLSNDEGCEMSLTYKTKKSLEVTT